MSDQEVTYSTVRFHKSSSELQSQVRPSETQGSRDTGHKGCSVPWHLVSIILGILCSVLLVTVAVLVTHINLNSQEKHNLQKDLNDLHQKYYNMENQSSFKEEMLRNKSAECEARKHQEEENRCLQCTGKYSECPQLCCGLKYYYFILDKKRWNDCQQTCRNFGLSLLKIDDDERKFLQSHLSSDSYWIGLTYVEVKKEWKWIDNGASNLDLMTMNSLLKKGHCAFLSLKGIDSDDCARSKSCICEKRVDKSPGSVSTGSKRTGSAVPTGQ